MLESISEVKEVEKSSYMSFGEEEIILRQQNVYWTVVWILPLLAFILIILGVLSYQDGIFGFLLFASSLSGTLYCVIKFEQWSISSKFPTRILTIIAAIVLFLAVDHFYLQIFTEPEVTIRKNIGLFLILTGLFAYYSLWRYKD